MRGVGGGVGGPPLRDHLWQGPPLPVTLRLIHPPPKMTQGVMTPLTPLHHLQQQSLSGVARCWHSNAYFSLFFSLFFFDPPNGFVQIPRDGEGRSIRSDALYPALSGEWEVPVIRNAKITPVNEGGGGRVGGPPLRDHLWQGPPLPVTLRLIHPPA